MKEKKETIYCREIDDGDEDRKIKWEISLRAITIEICDTREQAEQFAAENDYNIKFI